MRLLAPGLLLLGLQPEQVSWKILSASSATISGKNWQSSMEAWGPVFADGEDSVTSEIANGSSGETARIETGPDPGDGTTVAEAEPTSAENVLRKQAGGFFGQKQSRGMKSSLALFVSISILILCAKRLISPRNGLPRRIAEGQKPQVQSTGEYIGTEETNLEEKEDAATGAARQKLAEIGKLLPAAQALAKALGTEEGEALLKTVQGSVAATGAEKDREKLTEAFESAMKALRRLHAASLDLVDKLVQGESGGLELALINSWNEQSFGLGEDDRDYVSPYLKTMNSFKRVHNRLSQRMVDLQEYFRKEKPFQSLDDEEALISAAKYLEAINSMAADRAYALQGALQTGNGFRGVLRALLVGRGEFRERRLQGALEMLEAFAATVVDKDEVARVVDPSQDFSDDTSPVVSLRKNLRKCKAHMSLLVTETALMRASNSVADMVAAHMRAVPIGDSIFSIVKKVEAVLNMQTEPAYEVDSSTVQMLRIVLANANERVLADNEVARKLGETTIQNASAALREGYFGTENRVYIGKDFVRRVLKSKREVLETMEARAMEFEDMVNDFERSEDLSKIKDILAHATGEAHKSVESKVSAELDCVASSTIAFLARDVEREAHRVSALIDKGRAVYSFKNIHSDEIRKQINKDIRTLEEADTIQDIVDAAASLREISNELQSLDVVAELSQAHNS